MIIELFVLCAVCSFSWYVFESMEDVVAPNWDSLDPFPSPEWD